MSEAAIQFDPERRIYDKIFDQICSLLSEETIGRLRGMLHSVLSEQDLSSFCTDRNRLYLFDRHFQNASVVRVFRSNVFCVRLKVFAETNHWQTQLERIRIMADIQDGEHTESRLIVDWTAPKAA